MGAQRITRHEGARYKVMGVDSDLWETLTHIRYTCEHVRFPRPIGRLTAKPFERELELQMRVRDDAALERQSEVVGHGGRPTGEERANSWSDG